MFQVPYNIKLYAIIVIIIASFSTCMPIMVYNYYRPAASGGVLSQSVCADSVGPQDLIYFENANIKIGLRLHYVKKGYVVNIIFRVPEGGKVSFSHKNVLLKTSGEILTGKITHRYGWPPWVSTDPPTLLIKSGISRYTLEARISAPQEKSVSLSIPKLSINSKQYELPEVKFELDSMVEYFSPINC